MKKSIFKAICVAMIVLVIISVYGAITVTGNGFLDLSNWARYILFILAAFFAAAGIISGIKGWSK